MEMFKSNDNLQLPQIRVDLPAGPLAMPTAILYIILTMKKRVP